MPYTFNNIDFTQTAAGADFYSIEDLQAFMNKFMCCHITDVVQIKASLKILLHKAVKGRDLFNTNQRWPETDDPVVDTLYFSNVDPYFNRVISLILNALDSCSPSDNDTSSIQNSFKQLADLRLKLNGMIYDSDYHWDRTRAERRLSAVWKEPTLVQQQDIRGLTK